MLLNDSGPETEFLDAVGISALLLLAPRLVGVNLS